MARSPQNFGQFYWLRHISPDDGVIPSQKHTILTTGNSPSVHSPSAKPNLIQQDSRHWFLWHLIPGTPLIGDYFEEITLVHTEGHRERKLGGGEVCACTVGNIDRLLEWSLNIMTKWRWRAWIISTYPRRPSLTLSRLAVWAQMSGIQKVKFGRRSAQRLASYLLVWNPEINFDKGLELEVWNLIGPWYGSCTRSGIFKDSQTIGVNIKWNPTTLQTSGALDDKKMTLSMSSSVTILNQFKVPIDLNDEDSMKERKTRSWHCLPHCVWFCLCHFS